MTVEDLNKLDQPAFVNQIGWVFEHSPWVAERSWRATLFRDIDGLHHAMVDQVQLASREEQLALLRAHPDLGGRVKLSDASASEQVGAGLDRLTHDEIDRFTALNDRYRDRFGFPFLLAVKSCTKDQILAALEQRLSSSQEAEFAEALQQVYRIAAFRLHDVLTAGE